MSSETLLDMDTIPSILFMKIPVRKRSPALFSWGMILSAIQITRVFLLLRMIRAKVLKQGDMNGIQYLKMTRSSVEFLSLIPVLIQLNGLMEFTDLEITRSR